MKKLLTLMLLVSLCFQAVGIREQCIGYIKDMLKIFANRKQHDWITSILSNNIKVDKDGEETLEIPLWSNGIETSYEY